MRARLLVAAAVCLSGCGSTDRQALPGPPSASAPTPAGGLRADPPPPTAEPDLTEGDTGRTVFLRPGARLVVRLPGGAAGGFRAPTSSSPRAVVRTTSSGGFPHGTATATFLAAVVGRADLMSTTDFACLHAAGTRCLPPQRQWVVHVVVRGAVVRR